MMIAWAPEKFSRLPWRRSEQMHQRFTLLWGDLATYNAERSRGIVHTPDWIEHMWKKKAWYDLVADDPLGDLWNPFPVDLDTL